jgi:hypothetical protein
MSPLELADLVLVIHFAFLAFVVVGGVLVVRWPKMAWLHLPAVIWGALIEFSGWICPLTPLENDLRHRAGEAGYAGGFIAHYVMRILYPDGLTRGVQVVLGLLVLALNAAIYGTMLARARHNRNVSASRAGC